jgi:hypothetical protein
MRSIAKCVLPVFVGPSTAVVRLATGFVEEGFMERRTSGLCVRGARAHGPLEKQREILARL